MAHRTVARGLLELMEVEDVGRVESIRYRHAEDGNYYEHKFGPGVTMTALEDGSLRIHKAGSTVWSDL